MKNEVFKPRKLSKAFLCFIAGCLLYRRRIRYFIWEDGRVEICSGWGKSKVLNELHQVIYYPKNWLNNRIRINYRNTFELLDPERPQDFLKALRWYAPQLKIEEK